MKALPYALIAASVLLALWVSTDEREIYAPPAPEPQAFEPEGEPLEEVELDGVPFRVAVERDCGLERGARADLAPTPDEQLATLYQIPRAEVQTLLEGLHYRVDAEGLALILERNGILYSMIEDLERTEEVPYVAEDGTARSRRVVRGATEEEIDEAYERRRVELERLAEHMLAQPGGRDALVRYQLVSLIANSQEWEPAQADVLWRMGDRAWQGLHSLLPHQYRQEDSR